MFKISKKDLREGTRHRCSEHRHRGKKAEFGKKDAETCIPVPVIKEKNAGIDEKRYDVDVRKPGVEENNTGTGKINATPGKITPMPGKKGVLTLKVRGKG